MFPAAASAELVGMQTRCRQIIVTESTWALGKLRRRRAAGTAIGYQSENPTILTTLNETVAIQCCIYNMINNTVQSRNAQCQSNNPRNHAML
jgi:hypothetical protein